MKPKSQALTADGFDTNVAEKMPKIRKLEEPLPSSLETEPQTLGEDPIGPITEISTPEAHAEGKVIFESPKKEVGVEQGLDILKLIEDLHGQLLVSAQTKRALEIDLVSSKRASSNWPGIIKNYGVKWRPWAEKIRGSRNPSLNPSTFKRRMRTPWRESKPFNKN
jgi:hypothetical protein